MHGLPCKGLVGSVRGCNNKNGCKKPRSCLIEKYYLPRTLHVRDAPQLMVYKLFCEMYSLYRRPFLASRGQAEAGKFTKITWIPPPGNVL